jgi:hypothetical protein
MLAVVVTGDAQADEPSPPSSSGQRADGAAQSGAEKSPDSTATSEPKLDRWDIRSIAVLTFGALIIGAVLWQSKACNTKSDWPYRLVGLTIIVCSTVFLITTYSGKDELTTVAGLFGSLGGYILGKDNSGMSERRRLEISEREPKPTQAE